MSSSAFDPKNNSGNERLPRKNQVRQSILAAQQAGFTTGRTVRIGHIHGRIEGYNIARCGSYGGDHYPLVVRTTFGITKCRLAEVRLG